MSLEIETTQQSTVILQHGTEEVEVNFEKGKTVSQLFDEHAQELGYNGGNSAFRLSGAIISGNVEVAPDTVYTATVAHDTKG